MKGGLPLRTIEAGKTTVDVIAWPENLKWEGRYKTSSTIEKGCCKLILSPEIFHDPSKANTTFKRFAKKMFHEGLNPPNVIFRNMISKSSKNIFCVLSTKESVFNSACMVEKMYVVESGTGNSRRICAVLLRNDIIGENNT